MDSIESGCAADEALNPNGCTGHMIESHTLTAASRNRLIRTLEQYAHTEYVGMLLEGPWIIRAPTLHRKSLLLAKMQMKAAHALSLYGALAALGVSREKTDRQWLDGTARYLDVFNYPALSWADVGMIGWLTGAAGIVRQAALSRCVYGSCARLVSHIGVEKRFHHRQGFDLVMKLARGTRAQRQMAQDALDRWWWPTLLIFDCPDDETEHSSHAPHHGNRREFNDRLRQKFIDETVPQVRFLELSVPDDDLRLNRETGRYEVGQVDWEAFERIMHRSRTCNLARINARRKAWNDGAWVRQAVAAYTARTEVEENLHEQGSL